MSHVAEPNEIVPYPHTIHYWGCLATKVKDFPRVRSYDQGRWSERCELCGEPFLWEV